MGARHCGGDVALPGCASSARQCSSARVAHVLGGYRDNYFSQLRSRDRFMQLHCYLHIVPPVPRSQRQTIVEKTAPFSHQCQRLFQQYYIPGRDFAVDETMTRFEGHSFWITVIKGKPTPVGYKLYSVASQGPILGFRIFRGKSGYERPQSVLHHTVIELLRV
jgi:hypothetical protein